jgi:molybdenum cofactor cytidylyltransferase
MTSQSTIPNRKTGSRVCAILLAAGRSKRMGAFKPLLPFGNSTVIESCITYLREGGVDDIVVVVGHRGSDVQNRLKHAEVLFAVNQEAESEMGGSIARGVDQIPPGAGATVIALTDHPAVPASVVSNLIEAWRSGAKLAKPEFEGRGGHPVLVDLSFRQELLSLDPAGGLKTFFVTHRDAVRRLSVTSPFVARDMDTWDDYRALHQEVFGFTAPSGSKVSPTKGSSPSSK